MAMTGIAAHFQWFCLSVLVLIPLQSVGGLTSVSPVRGTGTRSGSLHILRLSPDDDVDGMSTSQGWGLSRRQALSIGITVPSLLGSTKVWAAEDVYRQAKRPTAYFVDSTVPPTLLPLNAPKETSILSALAKGSGTDKEVIVDDSVNLNNMLNKAVFGTIDAVSNVVGGSKNDENKSGPGYASFVCLGLPKETQQQDVDLALGLLKPIFQARKSGAETALGLSFAPISTQSALDQYIQNGSEDSLAEAMTNAGVDSSTFSLHVPLLKLARSGSVALLALAPENDDVQIVRNQGLQNIDPARRSAYVADAEGFIALTQDPQFKLYADRSLLKDFEARNDKDQPGNFFAERILVHETAATVVARYAATRPDSLVAVVAPIPDVRFLLGLNGRIPRICKKLNPDTNKVSNDAVTTILLNPTAKETLSLSRYLRLEIGTAPENLAYQAKVADYLWFSKMPTVNMLPRLMNPR